MIEFSLAIRNDIANTKFFGGEDFTIKAYSNVIGSDGSGGTELTTDGYAPIEVTNDTTVFPTATTGTRANAVVIETDEFTEDATIQSYGIFKTSDDTYLARVVLGDDFTVSAGQKLKFVIGSINFTPTNPS